MEGGRLRPGPPCPRNLLNVAQITLQDVREAQQHLRQALKQRPDLVEAHALLGEIYFRLQEWKEAEDHLKQAVQADPMLARLLMQAAIAQGDTESGNQWAKRTIEACRQRLNADPNSTDVNSAVTRLVLVEGFMNLKEKDYDTAQEGIGAREKTGPAASGIRAGVRPGLRHAGPGAAERQHAHRYGQALVAGREGFAERPEQSDSASPTARRDARHRRRRGASAQTITGTAGAGPVERAVLHMALGLDAYAQGKPEQARIHWERAFDLDPDRMLVAANNVAWLLSHPQSGDQNTARSSWLAVFRRRCCPWPWSRRTWTAL